MKAFFPVSRTFTLRAFLVLALVTPIAWVHANSGGITDKITGREPMRHYFSGQSNSAQFVVNGGFYAIMNMSYAGEDLMKNRKFDQGPRRSTFGGFTTEPLDWYQTILVKIDVYNGTTNQKIDTYNWSGKLAQPPQSVGFSYKCAIPPGTRVSPFQADLSFSYEKGTDPASPHVNVNVK